MPAGLLLLRDLSWLVCRLTGMVRGRLLRKELAAVVESRVERTHTPASDLIARTTRFLRSIIMHALISLSGLRWALKWVLVLSETDVAVAVDVELIELFRVSSLTSTVAV